MHGSGSHSQPNFTRESASELNSLGPDLIEQILSCLPITSILRATSVCKSWNSIIHSQFFKTNRKSDSNSLPWFFIYTYNHSFPNRSHIFAFDPESNKWIKLPDQTLQFEESFTVSNRFISAINPQYFCFKQVFSKTWHQIVPPRLSKCENLICAYDYDDPDFPNLTRFILTATDLKSYSADSTVNIYNPGRRAWELCPPPPHVLGLITSSDLFSSVIYRNKFYLYGGISKFILSFDLERRTWSNERSLEPPGVIIPYLVSCQDLLVLAGSSRDENEELEFKLWRIDERTLEHREIGVMPEELLSCFFGSKGERNFKSLKSVGSGNLVYVFSEEIIQNFPACVCEINNGTSECRWRQVPGLPVPIPQFWRYNTFCSHVSVQDILGNVR